MNQTEKDMVGIVNFGGQYAHLISRRLRELNVFTKVIPYKIFKQYLKKGLVQQFKALILSGGPLSVNDFQEEIDEYHKLLDLEVPVLGICFGHQLIGKLINCEIRHGGGEFGRTLVRVVKDDPLLYGWNKEEYVWMSHNDCLIDLNERAEVLSISEKGYIAAFRVKNALIYGVQFHPEVRETVKGKELLENFLKLTKIKRSWKPEESVETIINYLRNSVKGDSKALVAISGGIDSTVSVVLAEKAIHDRVIPVLIDHGLFREGELEEVINILGKIGIKPLVIDAKERFLSSLEGVSDCEERRKIVGRVFAEIFQELAIKDKKIKYLIQGTTYPDIVESGFEFGADRIKSHHNVAALPKDFSLEVIEPLRDLYKDEVRNLGRALGLPELLINRHPFPGPGLAVRVVGTFSRRKLEIVRKASKILEDSLREAGYYGRVWQAFAVVGDDKWVGVKGDSRSNGYIVTLRVVSSEDGMTADWVKLPNQLLDKIANRIVSELSDVTMVTYAITTKPPSTIEPC